MSKPLVILGTARRDGETQRAINISFSSDSIDLVMVGNHKISGYDYGHANAGDEFLSIIEKMLKANTIVFATPVYWYAMSAELKVFFDRLSDLLTLEKPKGRALKDKDVWLIASGVEDTLPDGFEVPFANTAGYFNMRYRGAAYLYTGDNPQNRLNSEVALADFGRKILSV